MIIKRWKQHKCSLADEWIDKTWYICKMESYLAKIRNEVPIHAITLIYLENIITERSHTQKATCCMIQF